MDVRTATRQEVFVKRSDASAPRLIDRLRGSRSMVAVVVDPEAGVLGLVTKDSVVDVWASTNDMFPR